MSDNQVGLLRLRLVHFHSVLEDLNFNEICLMLFVLFSFYCDRDHYGGVPGIAVKNGTSWVRFLSGSQIFSLSRARVMLLSSLFTSKQVYAKTSFKCGEND